mmetsp:Transcript_12710/g.16057  ORF Transcript_12710/g.16057 Transcript_12710/m.16057 type:complete len:264 (-) Transcript_12710:277-1068(-)|eukprot:CAMPEP_0172498856 /NCGR_PEP_ID=MMETSP1066-20121228/118478_1 /TAXON_ID=671091 /ORGANISM="Coscinodiscus wailesii, Strain CCMP2513" /LENGTH=263 /DNA_ID=CAMNT_0013272305 /DNA_START=77 /DNA_END=868 /DNA_ORIENTATION=-
MSNEIANEMVKMEAKKVIGEGAKTDTVVTSVTDKVFYGIAGVAVLASVGGFVLTEGRIVDFATSLTAVFSGYAAYQKHELRELKDHREVAQELHAKADKMKEQNELLKANVSKIENHVKRVDVVEGELQKITGVSKENVDRLMKCTNEYKKIHERMKEILKVQIMQTIITTVIQSDTDRDFTIEEKELGMLVLRLGLIEGINFNEERFRKLFAGKQKHSIKSVLAICKDLMDSDVTKKTSAIQVDTRSLVSSKKGALRASSNV